MILYAGHHVGRYQRDKQCYMEIEMIYVHKIY